MKGRTGGLTAKMNNVMLIINILISKTKIEDNKRMINQYGKQIKIKYRLQKFSWQILNNQEDWKMEKYYLGIFDR